MQVLCLPRWTSHNRHFNYLLVNFRRWLNGDNPSHLKKSVHYPSWISSLSKISFLYGKKIPLWKAGSLLTHLQMRINKIKLRLCRLKRCSTKIELRLSNIYSQIIHTWLSTKFIYSSTKWTTFVRSSSANTKKSVELQWPDCSMIVRSSRLVWEYYIPIVIIPRLFRSGINFVPHSSTSMVCIVIFYFWMSIVSRCFGHRIVCGFGLRNSIKMNKIICRKINLVWLRYLIWEVVLFLRYPRKANKNMTISMGTWIWSNKLQRPTWTVPL